MDADPLEAKFSFRRRRLQQNGHLKSIRHKLLLDGKYGEFNFVILLFNLDAANSAPQSPTCSKKSSTNLTPSPSVEPPFSAQSGMFAKCRPESASELFSSTEQPTSSGRSSPILSPPLKHSESASLLPDAPSSPPDCLATLATAIIRVFVAYDCGVKTSGISIRLKVTQQTTAGSVKKSFWVQS